jgi:hypothetical protein
MCLGQRPTLNAHATTFVTYDPSEYISRVHSDDGDTLLGHQFFAASSKLFDTLYKILVQIYVPEDRNPSDRMIISPSFASIVIDLEDKLGDWADSLPQALKLPPNAAMSDGSHSATPALFLRQRYAAIASFMYSQANQHRFLQVQIMLYRPGLAAMLLADRLEPSSRKTLKQSTFSHSASACVVSAQELIALCRMQIHASTQSQMQAPWWMNVLCT